MKHTFQATAAPATHVRTSDGVEGILHEHSDTSVVLPLSALVDLADFTLIPEPPEPVIVPSEIANWRARAVLEIAGLLPTVDAAIAALTGDAGIVARSAWNSGAPLARNGPTVLSLSSALGLSSAQVDAMFLQAESLDV
jgi:hypothetical protein